MTEAGAISFAMAVGHAKRSIKRHDTLCNARETEACLRSLAPEVSWTLAVMGGERTLRFCASWAKNGQEMRWESLPLSFILIERTDADVLARIILSAMGEARG